MTAILALKAIATIELKRSKRTLLDDLANLCREDGVFYKVYKSDSEMIFYFEFKSRKDAENLLKFYGLEKLVDCLDDKHPILWLNIIS